MCIGGFYIDQFLRNPEFGFGNAMEEPFMHEVRKAIIIEHHQQMKPVLKLLILMIKGNSYLLYYCYFSYGHIYWHITQILICFCQFCPEPWIKRPCTSYYIVTSLYSNAFRCSRLYVFWGIHLYYIITFGLESTPVWCWFCWNIVYGFYYAFYA